MSPWKEGDGLPYDGAYNGNVPMMIGNGTYADYRPWLIEKAMLGKLARNGTPEERVEESMKQIEKWDAEWESIPVETRRECRNRVIDDTEIKDVVIHTVRGPMRVKRAKPSENNNLDKKKNRKSNIRKKKMRPSGSVDPDFDPFANAAASGADKAAMKANEPEQKVEVKAKSEPTTV